MDKRHRRKTQTNIERAFFRIGKIERYTDFLWFPVETKELTNLNIRAFGIVGEAETGNDTNHWQYCEGKHPHATMKSTCNNADADCRLSIDGKNVVRVTYTKSRSFL